MRAAVVLTLALGLVACQRDAGPPAPADSPAERVVVVAGVEELAAGLAARHGRPLLVNLWAMWCQPCVEELPDLVAARRGLREQGGELIGLAMDLSAPGQSLEDVRDRLPRFLAERGIDYPVWLYGADDPNPVIQHFQLQSGALPITLAFDRDGRLVAIHDGKADPEDLALLVRTATGG